MIDWLVTWTVDPSLHDWSIDDLWPVICQYLIDILMNLHMWQTWCLHPLLTQWRPSTPWVSTWNKGFLTSSLSFLSSSIGPEYSTMQVTVQCSVVRNDHTIYSVKKLIFAIFLRHPLETFLIPLLRTRSHAKSAHTFRSSHWFLEVPPKRGFKSDFWNFLNKILVPHSATRLAATVTLAPHRVEYGVCTVLYCTVISLWELDMKLVWQVDIWHCYLQ